MGDQSRFVYFVGTAGSGKSSMAGAYLEWCRNQGIDVTMVNLDPGVERLPYTPDVDVRDWIKLDELMTQDGLGPNGAQIAASDLLALRADEIKDAIDGFRSDYVLVDTPGQIELFVFRQSGRFLTEFLAPGSSLVAYLIDPVLAREPSSYVSQLLLSTSVHFRLGLPTTHVLSKSDLLEPPEIERILEWSEHPDSLEPALVAEHASMYREMNMDVLRMLEALGTLPSVFPVSSADLIGLEDLYAAVQTHFSGGEDPLADALNRGDDLEPAP